MATASQQLTNLRSANLPDSDWQPAEDGRIHIAVGLSTEFNKVLGELADRYCGGNRGDVFNVAVGMMKFLADSAREGKRVGVAAPDQELETEIVGL